MFGKRKNPSKKLEGLLHIQGKSEIDSLKESLMEEAKRHPLADSVDSGLAWDYYLANRDSLVLQVLQGCYFKEKDKKFHLKQTKVSIHLYPKVKTGFLGLFRRELDLSYDTKREIHLDFNQTLASHDVYEPSYSWELAEP